MKQGKLNFTPQGDSGGEIPGYCVIPDNFSQILELYSIDKANISKVAELVHETEVYVELENGFVRARTMVNEEQLDLIAQGKLPIIIKGVGRYDIWGPAEVFENEK